MAKTKVAFVFYSDTSWIGGLNYFKNLWNALEKIEQSNFGFVIFTGTRRNLEDIEQHYPSIKIIELSMLRKGSKWWLLRLLLKILFFRDILLERELIKNGVQILSHYNTLGKSKYIRTIGWIPDFQVTRLPDFFNLKEKLVRHFDFRFACQYCEKLVVSSQSAYLDLKKFSKRGSIKAEILRFSVPPIQRESFSLDQFEKFRIKHDIGSRFFFLPNQFWVHKNHQVVIEALNILNKSGKSVQIVCTGLTQDPRWPKHFESISKSVKEFKLESSLIILGIVGRDIYSALLKHSIAILQPSLFEGWSTTVEEAKANDKLIILSDIDTHREQNPRRAVFFNPRDPHMLASIIIEQSSKHTDYTDLHIESEIIQGKDQIVFAKNYEAILSRSFLALN